MPSTPTNDYLIIIPAYNSKRHLPELLKRVGKLNISLERLLFINDGSTDETKDFFKANQLNFLDNRQNIGKGASLKKAFKHVVENYPNVQFVITMDSDLQHEPEFLPKFIEKYNDAEGRVEVILGNRLHDTNAMPYIRILSNKMTSYFVSLICKVKIYDSQSGYRLLSRKVIENVKLKTNNYETESELLLKAATNGYIIEHLNISTIYGDERSSIRHFRDTMLFLKMYFNFLRGNL